MIRSGACSWASKNTSTSSASMLSGSTADLLGFRLVRLLLLRTAVAVRRRQLQAVERALAGQRLAAILRAPPSLSLHVVLVQRHSQHRIAPQLVMVIEIRIAQRQPEHALRDQIQQRMFDLLRLA